MFTRIKKRIVRFAIKAIAEEQSNGTIPKGESGTNAGDEVPVPGSGAASLSPTPGATSPLPVQSASKTGHVFISYSSKEKPKAYAIKAFIEKNRYPCWMAPDSLHMRGTQDYSQDIHDAIRDSRCLVFALSPNSLNSEWARKEVRLAIEKYHKPVIPFFVAPIPEARKESEALYVDLTLEKQLLNENLAAKDVNDWDFSVMLPYLESAFRAVGAAKMAASTPKAEGDAPSSTPGIRSSGESLATIDQWKQWLSIAEFHLDRIKTLSAVDPLQDDPLTLSPEAVREGLVLSTNEAAMALMRILSSAPPIQKPDDGFDAESLRHRASRSLAQLVYERGDDFDSVVHEFAEPYANASKPWAAFVAHVRYYSPDGKSELRENNQTKARRYLEIAVLDPDNSWARIRLGICWEWGVGGDVSAVHALFWYEEARKMGNAEAYYWLSGLYRYPSFGVRYNPDKAKELADEGVNGGSARCHVILGDICRNNGFCNEKDAKESFFAKAEEEYYKAFRGGYHAALGEILKLKFFCGATLKHKEFEDAETLLQRASRANISGAAEAYVVRSLYGLGEVKEDKDVALKYALAGIRRDNVNCGRALADLFVWKSADEEAGCIDMRPVIEFVKNSSELLGHKAIEYLEYLPNEIPPCPGRDDFATVASLPFSDFWKSVFENEDSPSDAILKSRHSPARFLEFLQFLPAKPGNDWYRVKRLWQTFSFLELVRCAGEIRKEGWEDVFPADSLRLEAAEVDSVCALLADISEVWPTVKDEIAQKVDTTQAALKNEGAIKGVFSDNKIVKNLSELEVTLRDHATPNNKVAYVAHILSDIHRRLFNPYLAASLRLLRNGYLQKNDPQDGARFGFLFFAFNARYRNYDKNSSALFAAKDTLRKSIYQGYGEAVLPFLEICLSGRSVGLVSIPPDFEAIEQIEPVLWEFVETSIASSFSSTSYDLCVRIAFAMAWIFLDEDLKKSGGDSENWGCTSLYSITKGTEWISKVMELEDKGDSTGNIESPAISNIFEMAGKIIKDLEDDGYIIRKTLVQKLKKREFISNNWSFRNRAISTLAELVEKDSGIDAMSFKHVSLEGKIADLVISNDDVAVIFAVYPEENDYVAVQRNDDKEEPLEYNELSATRLDTLVKQREFLKKEETDAEFHLAIIASSATLESMRSVWPDELREKEIELVEYADYESFLGKYFQMLDSDSAPETDSASDEEEAPLG